MKLQKITDIPVAKIQVIWPECQRPYDDKWAQEIADKFDPDLFDPICVAGPNEEGIYHPIKGQHRVSAIRKMWPGGEQMVPCLIVATADRQRAAQIFLDDVDNKKRIGAVDRFNVAVTAECPDEVEVNEIVKGCGFIISNIQTENTIFAITSVMNVFRKYGAITLRRTIQTLTATWPGDRSAFQRHLILGYGMFLHTRANKMDWVQLRGCMQKITPSILVARGRAKANGLAKPVSVGVEIEIADAYNKSIKPTRRPKHLNTSKTTNGHQPARGL